jgi:hypothetical protein
MQVFFFVEGNLVCTSDQYQCTNGVCIQSTLVCDGHADCNDHVDESDCGKSSYSIPLSIELFYDNNIRGQDIGHYYFYDNDNLLMR